MREDILTIKEVAEYLKVTERTLYRPAQEGKIPAFKVGASWRFRRSDLDTWMDEQCSRPSVAPSPGQQEPEEEA